MTKQTKIVSAAAVLLLALIAAISLVRWQAAQEKDGATTNAVRTTAGSRGLAVEDFEVEDLGGSASALSVPPARKGLAPEREERLIIKTGTFSLVVGDVREAVRKITEYVSRQNGFVVNSSVTKEDLAPSASITVRIPVRYFEAGVGAIRALGEVVSEEVQGQDVTEEFVDLEARLKNLRATESALLAIMQRAGKIPDVLAVQRELMTVRGQIEQIQGRMKYLRESAAYATVTVYLATDPERLPVIEREVKWKPWAVVKDAVRTLLEFGQRLVEAVIRAVIVVLPAVIVIGLIGWLLFRLGRRWYRRWKSQN